jgi:flagellar biosynthetic protein FliQ
MNENQIVEITVQTLYLIIKVAAPMLIVSLIIGLIISLLQTITSIQEQTLTFVPKLIGVFIVVMIFGLWIMRNISEFLQQIASSFGTYIYG